MCSLKNINVNSILNTCFLLDAFKLIRTIKKKALYDGGSCVEVIKYINNMISIYAKEEGGYLIESSGYDDRCIDVKILLSKLHDKSEVVYINQDEDLIEQIEEYLVCEDIEERLMIGVEDGVYKYERYCNDFYKFLKELSVEVIPVDIFEDMIKMNDLYNDELIYKKNLGSSKYRVLFGEFKYVRIEEEHLSDFINESTRDKLKLELLRFYVSIYIALSENAELIGMKVRNGFIELVCIEHLNTPFSIRFCKNKVEAVVMLYMLREHMVGGKL